MHSHFRWILPLFLLVPGIATAQGTLQTLLTNIPTFLSDIVIPFLFGIAFLLFIINVIRYFVIEGSNEDGRKKAKDLALYSIAAFVFLIIFWGIVNMFVKSTGLQGEAQPCPDYIKQFDASKCP